MTGAAAVPATETRGGQLTDLAQEINAAHQRCEAAQGEALWHAREAGELLRSVKEGMEHGAWGPWLQKHCDFSDRTARVYMGIARRWDELPKDENGSALPISLAKARRLLSEPEPEPLPKSPARAALVRHLRRIMCGGEITEAVFESGFATKAMTTDHLLLVLAPPLEGAPELEEPVGVPELDTLIKMCSRPGCEETLDQLVRLDGGRLVINGPNGGQARLLTAEPWAIQTVIDTGVVDKLLGKVGNDSFPVPKELTVRKTFSVFGTAPVVLSVGPSGGEIRVGAEPKAVSEWSVPDMRASECYELLFGSHLTAVLGTVGEDAVMRLSGPGGMVAVEDEGFRYFLSPTTQAQGPAPTPPFTTIEILPETAERLRAVAEAESLADDDATITRLLDEWEARAEGGKAAEPLPEAEHAEAMT